MAGLTFSVTVDSGDLTFTLPAYNTGTYNATVFWGDTSSDTITTYNQAETTHTYSSAGTYEIEIQGTFPGFSFGDGISADSSKVVSVSTFGDTTDIDAFDYCIEMWRNCTNLAGTLPSMQTGVFDSVTNIGGFIRSATAVTGLTNFPSNSTITRADYFASGATGLNTEIPTLATMTGIPRLNNAFQYCTEIPSIAGICLSDRYDNCFLNCSSLEYDIDLFSSIDFTNRSPNFTSAFSRTSFAGTKAFAPEIWKKNFGTGTPTTTNAFDGAGWSESSADNYNGIPDGTQTGYGGLDWGGPSSIADPTITAVSDDTVDDAQNITITGDTFAYDSIFYLADNSDWDSKTTSVLQTLNSVTETGADIDIDFGTLTGTAYLHAVTYRAQDTGTGGYTMTLNSAGATDTPLTGTFSYSGGTVDANSAVEDTPVSGTFSYSGNTVDGASGISDTPQVGTFSFSGNVVIGTSDISDTPLVGTFSYTGATVDGSASISGEDTPLTGTFSYIGETISATSAIDDSPLTGTFSFSGSTASGISAISDTPQTGSFSYAGATVDGSASIPNTDTPLTGNFNYSGSTVSCVSDVSDAPVSGTFSFSGATVAATSALIDTPQPGTFSFSGGVVSGVSDVSDTPLSGTFTYSGGTVDGSAGTGVTDIPLVGLFAFSGALVSAISAVSDTPQTGTFSFLGGTVDGSSSLDVTITTTVYSRQIAQARRMIAAKGQLVTWREYDAPTDSTFAQTTNTYTDYENVSVLFTMPKKEDEYFISQMKGTSTPEGVERFLMAASDDFEPTISASIIRGTETLNVIKFDRLAPNGERILYKGLVSR